MFYSMAMAQGRKKRAKSVEKRNKNHNRKATLGSLYGSVQVVSTKETFGVASAALRNIGFSNITKLDEKFRDLRARLRSNRMKRIGARVLRNAGFKFDRLKDCTTVRWLDSSWGRSYYYRFHWLKMVGSERDFEAVVDFTLLAYNQERCRKFRLDKDVGLNKYIVQLSCGCCDADVYFRNDEAIAKAFQDAGLTSSGEIRDELGNVVDNVDTFYGFRNVSEERRSLGYLMNKAGITF